MRTSFTRPPCFEASRISWISTTPGKVSTFRLDPDDDAQHQLPVHHDLLDVEDLDGGCALGEGCEQPRRDTGPVGAAHRQQGAGGGGLGDLGRRRRGVRQQRVRRHTVIVPYALTGEPERPRTSTVLGLSGSVLDATQVGSGSFGP